MPVSWLKLMSFSFGAAVAALTGTLFAAVNASVFPLAFYFVLLITVYTMVILGGSGNQAGVVLGALVVGPLLELLRDPSKSRIIFFAALVVALGLASRRSRSLALVALSTLVFGFVLHAIAGSIHSGWIAGEHQGGLAGVVNHWVVAPAHLGRWIPPVAYVGVIGCVLADDAARQPRLSHSCRRSISSRSCGRTDAVEAGAGAVHRARADPDRADDRAAERPARRAARGDHLWPCSSCAACRCRSAV